MRAPAQAVPWRALVQFDLCACPEGNRRLAYPYLLSAQAPAGVTLPGSLLELGSNEGEIRRRTPDAADRNACRPPANRMPLHVTPFACAERCIGRTGSAQAAPCRWNHSSIRFQPSSAASSE